MAAAVRYGCDLVHWSTWQALSSPPDGATPPRLESPAAGGGPLPVLTWFSADVGIPAVVADEFEKRRDEWIKTRPAWESDDDEYARWLAKKDPAFFARTVPLIGWTQFRIEWSSLPAGVRLVALHATLTWSVGGAAATPRGGGVSPKEGLPWSLDLRPARPAP